MVTLHSTKKREGLTRKGGDYADKAIEVLNERGYLVEDRAADSGIFADIELSRKFSNETVIAEAKNTIVKFSRYEDGLAHYFAEWYDGDFDEFHFYLKELDEGSTWDTITNPDENSDELESLFESFLDEARDQFETPVSQVRLDDFRDFLANMEVFEYTLDDLTRIHERIERTGEYDDKPFLTEYEPLPEDGELKSNLLTVSAVPDTLYRISTIDGFEEADYWNYNSEYLPVEPHAGKLHSLIPPEDLPDDTKYYVTDDEVTRVDFGEWIDTDDPDRENAARALLVRLVALKARNKDCRYEGGNQGALLYARFSPEYGEERASDNVWVAKPANRLQVFRHRAVWVSVRRFASSYYFVFKPTKTYTTNGTTTVGSERKDELTHKFAGRGWPKNRRRSRTVDAWEAILEEPQQGKLDEQSDEPTRAYFEEVSSQLELSRVTGFTLPSRPPKNPREQRELIRSPKTMTGETEDFVEDIEEFL